WTNTYVQTTTTGLISAGASSFTVASASGMTVGDHIGVDQDAGTLYWSTILTIVGTTITIAGVVVSQASSGAMIYGYTTTAQQPLVVEAAVLRDSTGNDTPLKMMTSLDYDLLPAN